MEADARLILACGALLAAGLLVWLVADRFRAPSLVLFLVLGLPIGSDGVGWLLLGSILASTDGAAVFSLLRGLRLRARLARTLEAEAGLNDPVAFLLVVGLIELIQRPGFSAWDLLQLFVAELAVGAAVGLGVGWLAREALRRMPFAPHGVHLVGPLAALALTYGMAAALHGSGFLAAYLTGLLFGSTELPGCPSRQAVVEGVAALAASGLF